MIDFFCSNFVGWKKSIILGYNFLYTPLEECEIHRDRSLEKMHISKFLFWPQVVSWRHVFDLKMTDLSFLIICWDAFFDIRLEKKDLLKLSLGGHFYIWSLKFFISTLDCRLSGWNLAKMICHGLTHISMSFKRELK